jgi:hypothetical protein
LERDARAWDTLLARVRQAYPLPANSLTDPLPASLFVQTTDTAFVGRAEDSLFNYWHFDGLLNQCDVLLERAARDRQLFDDYAAKAFDIRLAVEQFAALDAIHTREIEAGYYSLPIEESAADANAEKETHDGLTQTSATVQNILTRFYSPDAIKAHAHFAQRAAFAAPHATYSADHKGELFVLRFDGSNMTVPGHVQMTADYQSTLNSNVTRDTLRSELQSKAAGASAAKARWGGKKVRADYEHKDADFKRNRLQVMRDMADLKARALFETDGALNYGEKLAPLRHRIDRDVRDAVARMKAVSEGLRLLLGYSTPLPPAVVSWIGGAGNIHKALSEGLVWVRDAIAWLSAFQQLDQQTSYPISVRRTVGENAWRSGLQAGRWSLSLPQTLWSDQRHVRLGGLSVFVEHNTAIWRVVVTPPRTSEVQHLNGSSVQLDQRRVPLCVSGRAASRTAARDPDIVAVNSLRNVSPIGTWDISCSTQALTGERIETIRDVVLDLYLTSRSV